RLPGSRARPRRLRRPRHDLFRPGAPPRPTRARQAGCRSTPARPRLLRPGLAREHRARARRRADHDRAGRDAVKPTLDALARSSGTFLMVAMDQRESLRAMLAQHHAVVDDSRIRRFKVAVARELGPYASGFLIDRHYAYDEIVRAELLSPTCGLILAADRLDQPPGGIVEDTDVDAGAEPALTPRVAALKLLVIWRDDAERARRADTARRFVELAASHDLLSVLEGVVRGPDGFDRESAIVEAAGELSRVGCDLYKCEVPTHGEAQPEEITDWSRRIDGAVPC